MSLRSESYSLRRHGETLGTRALGAEIAAELRSADPRSGTLTVDFEGIRIASSPVLDEIAITLRALIRDFPERHVLLTHLNDDLKDTLELVVRRRDIALTVFEDDGNLRLIGGSKQLNETLAAAEKLGAFTAPQLAERLKVKLPNLHQRLKQLEAAGALTEADDPTAERGRRLLFTTGSHRARESADAC
jgi:hypothetical protein